MVNQSCKDCAKRSTCQKATHFENYRLNGCSDFIDDNKTCEFCSHFIGGGDWNLCCTESHEGYPFGFLCYEDTPACEKFDRKLNLLDWEKVQPRIIGTISIEEALKDVEP